MRHVLGYEHLVLGYEHLLNPSHTFVGWGPAAGTTKHGVPSPPYERDCDVDADVNFDMFARMSADFAADIGDYERA